MSNSAILGVIVGAVAFMVGSIIGNAICAAAWRRFVEDVKTPAETVLSYDATVLMNERGQLSWIDNRGGVKKINSPD
jgi:hypothetical protein